MKQKIIFWGTPVFAVPILDALIKLDMVAAVVTQPDRAQGRGRHEVLASAVKTRAQEAGLLILAPEKLSDPAFVEELKKLQPALFLIAAYGKIIPQSILELSTPLAINVHPSLLPLYRGPSPIQSALLAQDTATGVTLIQLDEEMDHGPIIAQQELSIATDDTYTTLSPRLSELGAELALQALPGYLDGSILPKAQDHSKATYCKLLKAEDGLLDLSKTTAELYAHVRALEPWPGSYLTWNGLRLKIHSALPASGPRPATLFSRSNAGKLLIQASDGALEALMVQLEGKPPMQSSAFLNGHPQLLESAGV